MSLVGSVIIACAFVVQIEHVTVRIDGEKPHAFMGAGPTVDTETLFIDAGGTLLWFDNENYATPQSLILPNDTIAFDIANVDENLGREIIVMTEAHMAIGPLTENSEFREIAVFEDRLAASQIQFPAPLVYTVDDVSVIAVYEGDRFNLIRADGEVVKTVPAADADAATGEPRVNVWRLGKDRLHFSASRRWTPDLSETKPEPIAETTWPQDLAHQFYMSIDGEKDTIRAYVQRSYEKQGTEVSIVHAKTDEASHAESQFRGWAARSFVGLEANGDGFRDLVLWSTKEPGMSVGSLTRAAAAQTWPATLAIHLFDASRERFAAQPYSRATVDLPVPWFLSGDRGAPFRLVTTADLDNDGKDDLGFARSEDQYGIWLSAEREVLLGPVHTIPIEPPLHSAMSFKRRDGREAVFLHCGQMLHFIWCSDVAP